MKIIDGLMKRTMKAKSLARPVTISYADGTVLDIPKECCTRTGLFRRGVAKAILLKDYGKLANQYGVRITKKCGVRKENEPWKKSLQ